MTHSLQLQEALWQLLQLWQQHCRPQDACCGRSGHAAGNQQRQRRIYQPCIPETDSLGVAAHLHVPESLNQPRRSRVATYFECGNLAGICEHERVSWKHARHARWCTLPAINMEQINIRSPQQHPYHILNAGEGNQKSFRQEHRTAGGIAGAEQQGSGHDPAGQPGRAAWRRLQRRLLAERMVSHHQRLPWLCEGGGRAQQACPTLLPAARSCRVWRADHTHPLSHLAAAKVPYLITQITMSLPVLHDHSMQRMAGD